MGSLPREKAGVGSAVNDTTRQMGGALGVAIIGSVTSSIYAASIADAGRKFELSGDALSQARSSLGAALQVAPSLGARAGAFVVDVEDGFVRAFSSGLRLGAVVVLGAALVAWRYLPARAHDPLAVHAEVPDDTARVPVGGE
jgi:MFS transporter, DHA2 family, multidrug resistance protein